MVSHKKKHQDRTMIYIGIGIVVLIIFFAIFGLNFMIKSSLFLTSLVSGGDKGEQVTGSGEDFFGTLSVDDPPLATNSAQIIMTGTVTGFDKVEFYINNEKVDDTKIDNNGYFSKKINGLQVGQNRIYVRATTKKSHKTKKSEKFDVSYSVEKPTIEIQEPQPDVTLYDENLNVKGFTTGSEVKINDFPVIVDSQGNFERSLRLKEGDNEISVYAENDAGNSEQTSFTVKYEKRD